MLLANELDSVSPCKLCELPSRLAAHAVSGVSKPSRALFANLVTSGQVMNLANLTATALAFRQLDRRYRLDFATRTSAELLDANRADAVERADFKLGVLADHRGLPFSRVRCIHHERILQVGMAGVKKILERIMICFVCNAVAMTTPSESAFVPASAMRLFGHFAASSRDVASGEPCPRCIRQHRQSVAGSSRDRSAAASLWYWYSCRHVTIRSLNVQEKFLDTLTIGL